MNTVRSGPSPVGLGIAFVVLGLAGLWLGARPVDGAPVPREKPEREVRLADIYTMGPQKEMKRYPLAKENPSHDDLVVILAGLERCAVSNLFLVRGDDIKTAIRDTRAMLGWDRAKETDAEKAAREKSKKSWLFVYLGRGPSNPNVWAIRSVGLFGNQVKVFYTTADLTDRLVTMDTYYYCYWIPLGELKPGAQVLQLVDQASGEVVLMRKETGGRGG